MRRPTRWFLGLSLSALIVAGCGGGEPTTYPFEPGKDPQLEGMKEAMKKNFQSKAYRNPNKAHASK